MPQYLCLREQDPWAITKAKAELWTIELSNRIEVRTMVQIQWQISIW